MCVEGLNELAAICGFCLAISSSGFNVIFTTRLFGEGVSISSRKKGDPVLSPVLAQICLRMIFFFTFSNEMNLLTQRICKTQRCVKKTYWWHPAYPEIQVFGACSGALAFSSCSFSLCKIITDSKNEPFLCGYWNVSIFYEYPLSNLAWATWSRVKVFLYIINSNIIPDFFFILHF